MYKTQVRSLGLSNFLAWKNQAMSSIYSDIEIINYNIGLSFNANVDYAVKMGINHRDFKISELELLNDLKYIDAWQGEPLKQWANEKTKVNIKNQDK